MNPHYNQQQQPYYNYQQHVPGPPQPPWQSQAPQSPTGWNDPRFQTISPPPPPQSPPFGQNNFAQPPGHSLAYPPPPGIPGPPPNPSQRPQDAYHRPLSPHADTTQWGVRFNQGVQGSYHPDSAQTLQPDQRPALPPRPSSSLSQAVQQHQNIPPVHYQQTPTQYQPQGSWGLPFSQPYEHKPPTPPPRPAAYAAPNQYGQAGFPQEQYSHHVSSHHYDPQPQPQPQPSWQAPPPPPQQQQQQPPTHPGVPSTPTTWSQQAADGPVSPMEDDRRRQSVVARPGTQQYFNAEASLQNSQLPNKIDHNSALVSPEVKTGSTILGGFGSGPSDWQHYDLSDQQGSVEEHMDHLPAKGTTQIAASPEQTQTSLRRRSTERIRPAAKPVSTYSSAQTTQPSRPHDPLQRFGPELTNAAQAPTPPSQVPERQDSRQSEISSVSGVGASESIDNVIQAWYAPLTVDSSVQTSLPPTRTPSHDKHVPYAPPVRTRDFQVQTDFKPQIETKIETRVETREVEIDPYADIQNEYKATLKRFVAMLRQEAAATTDEEKFKVFQGFAIRETRLRSVLYGVEAQPEDPPKQSEPSRSADTHRPQTPTKSSVQPLAASQFQTPTQRQRPMVDTYASDSPTTKDDSFVVVNPHEAEDDEYSPGGRPRLTPLRIKTPAANATAQTPGTGQRSGPKTSQTQEADKMSPGGNAPMTLDDYIMPDQHSPSIHAPMVVDIDNDTTANMSSTLTGPLNFQPDRPLYQPFRYGEGTDSEVPLVSVHGPPTESFSALRQNQAAESGRTLVHDMPPVPNVDAAPNRGHSKTPSGGRREHEEAFIGLIRAKSQAIRKKGNATPRPDSPAILRAGTPANRSTPSPAPIPPLIKSVQSLRNLLPNVVPPQPGPKSPPHAKLQPLVASIQKVPEDFSFIHARVLSWDKSNRQTRTKYETERQARQSQNEEHIDQLFNDNEIGYADIAELEKDFRLAEAERKYREDQDELESFTTSVFDFVFDRIDGEIKELTRLQTNAIDMLDLESSSAAKQIQNAVSQQIDGGVNAGAASIAAIMGLLLEIHDKLEIRNLKIAEASFERERRRKRLELSVLYTNNDKSGIKKLEAEFTKAERLQVLEESRKKAERANKLLDSFDRVVVRGLAENQGTVDDVLTRAQLVRDLILGSDENGPQGQAKFDLFYGPDGVKDLVDRASATVDFIHTDSKVLVELLDKADTLSNNADFDLYISEAKLADATPEKYEKLKSEKAAEDIKVGEELASRLSGIAQSPNEISGLLKEIRDKIGADAGHEERIGKALEAAKLRNTTSSP